MQTKWYIFPLVFAVLMPCFFLQSQEITNLVFEGAGIKGLAYAGAVEYLESQQIMKNVERLGGTSSGAITALMIAIGYNADEMAKIISETNFARFNDVGWPIVGGVNRMKNNYGWYKGDSFEQWLEKLIEYKTGNADITFREMRENSYKDLYITGTCLNKQTLVIFSVETYPDMRVKDAIRVTISIPFYYQAVLMDSLGKIYPHDDARGGLDVFVDGGVIANYPIFIFDSITIENNKEIRIPNPHTLGFRIEPEEQAVRDQYDHALVPLEINNFIDFSEAFYTIVMRKLNRTILEDFDWERSVSISSKGIGPKIKKLSKAQKKLLINSGWENTSKYFVTRLACDH